MIKNLGQVAAIYIGKTAPRNVNMIWLNNTVIPYVFKSYNGEEWTEIPTGAWVETYMNGWLVSLQQGTVTTDDDYVLINSRGVNYRMTVKDFIKSSVGNPLDFRGVIRTDSDFPNPSTLEGGDMYIIITEPAGGTVTDPYGGKTFSDSEKIVWDSVINSWASLGKIDVKVDLSTTYSETEVTIHSSAGKETTVVGVTDDNAGVMVPVQKKWLDSLSDGSTLTPQGSSTAPYHKHRYSDIVDRIISQQVTGDSAINPMSQKATTEALNLKLDKSSVLQVSGVSTTDVMSQKAVTDAIQTLKSSVDDKLSRYLPLSGGTMAGSIVLANSNVRIQGIGSDGTTNYHMVSLDTANRPTFGSPSVGVVIQTNTENILHKKANGTYIVHDTSNLPDPAKLSANQTFTGDNAFTAGKFNVTGDKSKFSVNNVGGLRMYYDYADDELGISRYLDFYTKKSSDTDYTRRGIFGLYASKSTPNSDWAYIGVGDVDSENAQYKFSLDTLYIPETFYLRTLSSRRQLISVDNINNRAGFGGTLIPTWIISNNTDLFHSKYTNQSTHSEYKIWDESNLPSPASTTDLSKYALLAGNNTFSGSNTFALNKFQVGTGSLFRVNADTNLIVNGIVTGGWNKELVYYSRKESSSTAVKRGAFGIKADGATEPLDTDYLYLSVGEANWERAQYKFQANKLIVPNTWRLRTISDFNLITVDDVNEVRFGSNSIPNCLVSNNTDITHVRGSNNYKIYDSYNLPSPASTTDLSKYALLAGDNKFTGSNTFNKTVSVSKVGSGTISLNPSDGINYEFVSASAAKGYSITLGTADDPHTTTFGSVLTNQEYAYIALPGTGYDTAPYRFLVNQMTVPNVFSFLTKEGVLLLRKDSNGIQLGSGSSNTFVNSSNSDLTHRKYTASSTYTDYKIWDESNLPSPIQTSDLVDYVVKSDLDGYAKTTDLASYLPLAGGTLTGDLVLSNNNYIKGIVSTGTPIQILGLNSSNTISIGNGSYNLLLYTGASDISHWKGGTSYKIWDASNVSKPLNYVNGTAGSVTSVYTRNLNLNGTNYPFIGTGTTVVTLFAPTTAGTSGQVLQSQGAGKAPIWVDGGTGSGVQLSDDNVWTGLNTFQGGLKTSDGTNSYDVWDNNSLKYPVKYEINSIGNYNFNYYTKTAGWRRIDQVAINNILPDTITSLTNGGCGTLGLGTNAYESAAIADILTNSIYFEGLNARVLSTNSDGDLEYGSTTNYGDFNSRNIRIAYPISSGSGGSGGGSSTTYEGGLTIGYYPVNTKGTVTERAKIYCTTSNLYLKDLAKNTQLDFDTDGLYVTTGSSSKVRLATLNDVSGGGSSVSLDGNNTWTGVNIFSGTTLVTNQYDSGNTEIPSSAKYSIKLACGGSYNEYGFGAIRTEDRVKQSYSFVQTPSAFFIFDNSGSLYTTISDTKYEFWNKNNLAKPITYNTNTEGDAVLYKGDSASKIDRLILPRTIPDDSTPNILQGGTGGFGSAEHAYASCHIGAVYTNEIHTYIDNDMTATVNLTMDDNGVYFAKSDGTLYKLTMEVVS